MPCPEPWVCWCTVFGQVQAGLHKSLPRLGRAAAFLELAIPALHGARLCRDGSAICYSYSVARH